MSKVVVVDKRRNLIEVIGTFDDPDQAVEFMKQNRLLNQGYWKYLTDKAEYNLPPEAERLEILEKARRILDAIGFPATARDLKGIAGRYKTDPDPKPVDPDNIKIYGNQISTDKWAISEGAVHWTDTSLASRFPETVVVTNRSGNQRTYKPKS